MEPYGVSGPEAGSPQTCPVAMGALLTEGLMELFCPVQRPWGRHLPLTARG